MSTATKCSSPCCSGPDSRKSKRERESWDRVQCAQHWALAFVLMFIGANCLSAMERPNVEHILRTHVLRKSRRFVQCLVVWCSVQCPHVYIVHTSHVLYISIRDTYYLLFIHVHHTRVFRIVVEIPRWTTRLYILWGMAGSNVICTCACTPYGARPCRRIIFVQGDRCKFRIA